MRIVIIGAPASGKSTLTDQLTAADRRIRTFGVRRYFARQIELGSMLGQAAEGYVTASAWIPDELVANAIRHELRTGGLGDHFVLEGVPGNQRQARLLDNVLEDRGLPLHAAVHVATPLETCRARAGRRLVCQHCDGGAHQAIFGPDGTCARCGSTPTRRDTDLPERFARRLSQYTDLETGLLEHYRDNRLVTIDGSQTESAMLRQCMAGLAPFLTGVS